MKPFAFRELSAFIIIDEDAISVNFFRELNGLGFSSIYEGVKCFHLSRVFYTCNTNPIGNSWEGSKQFGVNGYGNDNISENFVQQLDLSDY